MDFAVIRAHLKAAQSILDRIEEQLAYHATKVNLSGVMRDMDVQRQARDAADLAQHMVGFLDRLGELVDEALARALSRPA